MIQNKKKIAAIGVGLAILIGGTGIISALGVVQDHIIIKQLTLGEQYLLALDYEQAIIAFNKAIQIDEKCVEAYIGLAQIYKAQGLLEKAVDILEIGYQITNDVSINEMLVLMKEELEESLKRNYVVYQTEDNQLYYIDTKTGSNRELGIKNVGKWKVMDDKVAYTVKKYDGIKLNKDANQTGEYTKVYEDELYLLDLTTGKQQMLKGAGEDHLSQIKEYSSIEYRPITMIDDKLIYSVRENYSMTEGSRHEWRVITMDGKDDKSLGRGDSYYKVIDEYAYYSNSDPVMSGIMGSLERINLLTGQRETFGEKVILLESTSDKVYYIELGANLTEAKLFTISNSGHPEELTTVDGFDMLSTTIIWGNTLIGHHKDTGEVYRINIETGTYEEVTDTDRWFLESHYMPHYMDQDSNLYLLDTETKALYKVTNDTREKQIMLSGIPAKDYVELQGVRLSDIDNKFKAVEPLPFSMEAYLMNLNQDIYIDKRVDVTGDGIEDALVVLLDMSTYEYDWVASVEGYFRIINGKTGEVIVNENVGSLQYQNDHYNIDIDKTGDSYQVLFSTLSEGLAWRSIYHMWTLKDGQYVSNSLEPVLDRSISHKLIGNRQIEFTMDNKKVVVTRNEKDYSLLMKNSLVDEIKTHIYIGNGKLYKTYTIYYNALSRADTDYICAIYNWKNEEWILEELSENVSLPTMSESYIYRYR